MQFSKSQHSGRKGGVTANVMVFMSAAIAVGFVSWLLLQYLIFDVREKEMNNDVSGHSVSGNQQSTEKGKELTAEEKQLIQLKVERRGAAQMAKLEAEKKLVEANKKLAKLRRVDANVREVNLALSMRNWKGADSHISLLIDDDYPHVEIAKLMEAVSNGKAKERADLIEIELLLDEARALDNGKYSPKAIEVLDKALLIYPDHAPTVALKKRFNDYPYSLRVPEDVATLNEAVDSLRAGDTLILGKGVFKFHALLSKGINIIGQGEKNTLIECDTRVTSAFTLSGDKQFYMISDLTVTGMGYEDESTERYPLIMQDADLDIRNVSVKNGSGHGIAVVSGRLQMKNCKLSGNAWDGVSVMGETSFADIMDSNISNNYDHGVDFWRGASGKLTNVTANENSGTGILIMGQGASVHLAQVKTMRNSQCGIVISAQANAKLERVFSSNNILSGVVVQGKGTKLTCGIVVSNKNGEAGFLIDPLSMVENFISMTAEGNKEGDVISKAMIQPAVPIPETLLGIERETKNE